MSNRERVLIFGFGYHGRAVYRLLDRKNRKYRKWYLRKSQNLFWIPRNVRLDPHPDYNYYSEHCLSGISRAFKARIPAIIDFHRVNISRKYNRQYRDKSLDELDKVLKSVKELWPETKFITTHELIQFCQATVI